MFNFTAFLGATYAGFADALVAGAGSYVHVFSYYLHLNLIISFLNRIVWSGIHSDLRFIASMELRKIFALV